MTVISLLQFDASPLRAARLLVTLPRPHRTATITAAKSDPHRLQQATRPASAKRPAPHLRLAHGVGQSDPRRLN